MGDANTQTLNEALCIYDTYTWRLIDAFGPDVTKCLHSFEKLAVDNTSGIPDAWTETLVDFTPDAAEVRGLGTTAQGVLTTTTNDTAVDGQSNQIKGEAFALAADKPLYFGCKLQIDDATQTDFIAGLCITDVALLGGMTDGIYFRKVDGSLSVATVTEVGSAETENLAMGTMANATDITLEFYAASNTSIAFYINGSLVATHTAGLTAEVLTPSIEFLTGDASANTMLTQWLRVIQIN